MSERAEGSNPELVALLRNEIATSGRITFARFMELAVGHPEHGYYVSGELRTGYTGDFLTAPETDPIFGQTLARQVVECWERLGQPSGFVVREDGAGRGMLAAHILSEIHHLNPELFATMTYELADISPTRIQDGLDFLDKHGFGKQARASTGKSIEGLLLANELLDAFPVHRLIREQLEIREIYTTWQDDWFQDETGPLSDPALADLLSGVSLAEDQRAEVSPGAAGWAADIGGQIDRGYAILIDYGYPAAELYGPERFDGTLRAYSQHDVSDDPYRLVGNQDLTAHVNFTAISQAAQTGGMVELGLTTQQFFLAGLGIEQVLLEMQGTVDAQSYITARHALMHLIDPRGPGRFRVLVLGKNIEASPPLRGLSFSF